MQLANSFFRTVIFNQAPLFLTLKNVKRKLQIPNNYKYKTYPMAGFHLWTEQCFHKYRESLYLL